MPLIDPNAMIENRVWALRLFHKQEGILKAELDVSGGIDSLVMACLLVLALGPENVILVHSRINTNREQTKRAMALAEALGVPLNNGNFEPTYDAMVRAMYDAIERAYGSKVLDEVMTRCQEDPTILGSIRSTLRAPIGRGFNRMMAGGLRHGTGNECEDRYLRFFQKGGDGEVDSNPLAMLSKAEVYQMAYTLGHGPWGLEEAWPVIRATIEAVPSPDLWGNGDGHTDEAELLAWTGAPFTYGRIDPDSGEVTRIGTIEMVSRFIDGGAWGKFLFCDELTDSELQVICDVAISNRTVFFPGIEPEAIEKLIRAARWAESKTRHKENPRIETLGTRKSIFDGPSSRLVPAPLSNDLSLYAAFNEGTR